MDFRFHVSAIVNSAAMNMEVHVYFWTNGFFADLEQKKILKFVWSTGNTTDSI